MLKRHRQDERVVVLIATLISFFSLLYFFRHAQLLLYGDAVAHLNIARRVVDSLTPGLKQLGTVWLPLPHLLLLPFIGIDSAWRTGLAGAFVSMAAYVWGSRGIFRTVSLVGSRSSAWLATAIYALNPNLIYLQTTAMTEALYLAVMVWAAAYFLESWVLLRHQRAEQVRGPLLCCGVMLLAATLIRYDGWMLAAVAALALAARILLLEPAQRTLLLRPMFVYLAAAAIGPLLWLGYNAATYGNPLEFANGPYSAAAIAARSAHRGDAPHPGFHQVSAASHQFTQAAKLNVADGQWLNWLWRLAWLAAVVALVDRRFRPALILWLPWLFYALSIAYGGIPIFIPGWWPFSYYNVRYGLELLPAIAVFAAFGAEILRRVKWTRTYVRAVNLAAFLLVIVSYTNVWWYTPICLREARVNAVSRQVFERALALELFRLPVDSRLLMFTGDHGGALQEAGVPFARVVHEGNYRLWESALADPAGQADFIVAMEGDPVAAAVAAHPEGLETLRVLRTAGQPSATLYRAHGRTPSGQ